MYRVTTPVVGFSGMSAGVNFTDGVAEVDDGPALRYFRSAGYGIEAIGIEAIDEEATGSDPAEMPKKSASTEAWRNWAHEHGGMDREEADSYSRDELVAHFTTEDPA